MSERACVIDLGKSLGYSQKVTDKYLMALFGGLSKVSAAHKANRDCRGSVLQDPEAQHRLSCLKRDLMSAACGMHQARGGGGSGSSAPPPMLSKKFFPWKVVSHDR